MKTIKLMAVVCLACFASSCELGNTEIVPNDEHLLINKEENIVKLILDDPLTEKYFNSLNAVFQIRELKKNTSDNNNLRITDFNSLEEFKEFVYDNFENPEETYQTIYNSASLGQEIRGKFPDIDKLSPEDFEKIVNQISFSIENVSYENAKRGQCEDQLSSDLQTCRDGALVAAAGCGLLTPTLLGALGCGGIVYLAELVCIDDADRSYGICKIYEIQ
ncbi:hypothetical protein [Algoriphagus chordae]|uniref:Lipoprotein n=1 Tax=Algoriphagus chordae TaxID=237019 RepID=A0A2W7RCN3_9BACT|nr:hypothetical protein [Algoriphagus chordae]PZX58184.1 hypothetical protein LV85_00370 [Algoriphagus chordae]